MAIGARRLHVLLQFLAEAVFLSVTGGVAGIIMGVAFSLAISLIFGWSTSISAAAIAGGFLFSAVITRPAKRRASIPSRRCVTSRSVQAPGSMRCSTRSRRTK
jgi:ABC-type lipoprotein release transport system permease subunit